MSDNNMTPGSSVEAAPGDERGAGTRHPATPLEWLIPLTYTRPPLTLNQRMHWTQSGESNHMWRGDAASYQALHLRVEAARGKPRQCSECGTTTAGRYEWANLTGRYDDTADYTRLCVSCHRRYDALRRGLTGQRTAPARGGDVDV